MIAVFFDADTRAPIELVNAPNIDAMNKHLAAAREMSPNQIGAREISEQEAAIFCNVALHTTLDEAANKLTFEHKAAESLCNVWHNDKRIAYTVKNKGGKFDYIAQAPTVALIADIAATDALQAARKTIDQIFA